MRSTLIAIAGLAAAAPAFAEVSSSGADGFVLSNSAIVPQPPQVVWRALVALPKWWDPAHTYSGKAGNLALSAKAGGCWCEFVPADGSEIERGRVVQVRPNHALRVYAALGPLQSMAVVGNLAWTLKAVDGGTELRQTYLVYGRADGGLAPLASPVNAVMTTQFDRLVAYASRRK